MMQTGLPDNICLGNWARAVYVQYNYSTAVVRLINVLGLSLKCCLDWWASDNSCTPLVAVQPRYAILKRCNTRIGLASLPYTFCRNLSCQATSLENHSFAMMYGALANVRHRGRPNMIANWDNMELRYVAYSPVWWPLISTTTEL